MIGTFTTDKKAQWEQHLPELLQVYNSTRSVVTGYSLHYLMFGRCLHLPVDFYFPMMGAHVHSHRIPAYVEVRKCFKEGYAEVHLQANSEVDRQKWYYDRATSTVQLVPGDIVLPHEAGCIPGEEKGEGLVEQGRVHGCMSGCR